MKTQGIRLVDVFLLGPAMIWIGATHKEQPFAGMLLALSGIATIVYNGENYLRKEYERTKATPGHQAHPKPALPSPRS